MYRKLKHKPTFGFIEKLSDADIFIKQKMFTSLVAPATGFDPSIYGTVWAWHKYNTGITLSGNELVTWDDQSGNARHITQATSTKRPIGTYGTALFDGVDDYLSISAQTSPADFTVFTLANFKDTAYYIGLNGGTLTTTTMATAISDVLDRDIYTLGSNGTNNGITTTDINCAIVGEYSVIITRYSAGNTYTSIFVNGVEYSHTVSASYTTTPQTGVFYLGSFDGINCSDIEIVENIIYSEALSNADILTVSNYLLSMVAKVEYGTLETTDFTDSVDYAANYTPTNPANFVITGSGLETSGGAGGSGVYTAFNYYTDLENWELSGIINTKTLGVGDYGIGVGITNSGYGFYSTIRMDTGAAQGQIEHFNNGTLYSFSSDKLTLSNDQDISFKVTRTKELYMSEYSDGSVIIKHSTVFPLYTLSFPNLNTSVGRFMVFSYGGTKLIKQFTIKSTAVINAPYCLFGDSISDGYIQGSAATRFINKWQRNPNDYVVLAGAGETAGDMVSRTDEVIALNPAKIIILAGANDLNQSIATATTIANLTTIITALETGLPSSEVIICKVCPFNGRDAVTLNAALVTAFGSRVKVDFYTSLASAPNTFDPALTSDGVHPNLSCAANEMTAELIASGI